MTFCANAEVVVKTNTATKKIELQMRTNIFFPFVPWDMTQLMCERQKRRHLLLLDREQGTLLANSPGELANRFLNAELVLTRDPVHRERFWLWDTLTSQCLAEMEHPGLVSAQIYAPSNLVISSGANRLRIWQIDVYRQR